MNFKRIALALLASASFFALAGCRHRCNSTRESNNVECCPKD